MNQQIKLTDVIKKWIDLQDTANSLMDSEKSKSLNDKQGVRQLLERKEGLFRMKMMGKRVNHAARSVISPDPYLNTNQVGIPLILAKKLVFPEYVNEYNLEKLRELVI